MRKLTVAAGIAGVALLAASCASTPQVTVQNTGSGTDAGGILVTGTGEVAGTPDTLTLTMGVSVVRPNVGEAVGDAARLADALIGKLKDAGVAEKDIQTANYSIVPEYDYRNETQTLRGYRVNNTVIVKLRDLDRAGEIIDTASAAAGNEVVVQGVAFAIDDDSALVVAARKKAFEEAKAKADQLARLGGVTLGAPVSITETANAMPVPFARTEAAAMDVGTPIEAGQQSVTVSVTVRFAVGS